MKRRVPTEGFDIYFSRGVGHTYIVFLGNLNALKDSVFKSGATRKEDFNLT